MNSLVYAKGSSLLEVLIYIALYSIICTGFVACVFGLQATLFNSAARHDDMAVSSLINILVQYQLDHADLIEKPGGNTSSSQVLVIQAQGASQTIGSSTLRRLLRSYPGMRIEDVSFSAESCGLNASLPPACLMLGYFLNGRRYEMHMQGP